MLDLSADVFGIAARPYTDYLPLTDFADASIPAARLEQEARGIPLDHLMLLATDDTQDLTGEPDVSAQALAALGEPACDQPLFLVRGALRDSMVAALAGLVHGADWAGEDLGITHLEELGGTVVFDLLDWAVPEETGATVLICDEPLVADARSGRARFAAVALRVRPGPGPLRILDCGEGEPGPQALAARHRFTGSGPCDGWLDFHAALAGGRVADGDLALLRVAAPLRQGWVLLRADDPARLRLAVGGPGTASLR